MTPKTHFTKEDCIKILSEYDIGKFTGFRPFTKGAVQTNIFIKTTKGKYVLRYYETRGEEYVKFELIILDYLHKHKYPAPMPIKNIHNNFLGKYNTKIFALFEYIEGKHIKKLNIKQREEMLKHLATLHIITTGYKPKYAEFRESHNQKYCITTCKQEYTKFKSKKTANERFKYMKEKLSSLQLPKSLPEGIAHCDYDIANIKFKKDTLIGVLDFDDSCYTYLIYDVASLIYYWCWIREKELKFTRAKKLLKSYNKYRKLSETEKEHIYDALKLIVLTYASWFFYEKYKYTDIFIKSQDRLKSLEDIGREEFYKRLF